MMVWDAVAADGADTASVVAAVAAIVLAVVLGWAAVTKAVDGAATADGFAALGLPRPAVLARLVPLAEAATAVGLVVVPRWAGLAAFGLLAVFTAVLVSMLQSGVSAPCACFGAGANRPVSAGQVVRNLVLLALAATVVLLTP